MLLLNAVGLPNSGRPSASFSYRVQPPLSRFGQLCSRAAHGTQTGGICHGSVLLEDKVAVTKGIHVAFVLPHAMDSDHAQLAVAGPMIETGHLAIRDQMDTMCREPRLPR